MKGKKEAVGLYECYDGDKPEHINLKTDTLPFFEKGLQHFFDREFIEAATNFQMVLKNNPKDLPAKLFLTKASSYIVSGVPENWTGVEIMTFK